MSEEQTCQRGFPLEQPVRHFGDAVVKCFAMMIYPVYLEIQRIHFERMAPERERAAREAEEYVRNAMSGCAEAPSQNYNHDYPVV